MSDKSYPIHFKKMVDGHVATGYAHNKAEEEKFLANGYLDQNEQQWQRQASALFPSMMYGKDGAQVKCENAAHEKDLLTAGYSVKPIVAKVAVPASGVVDTSQSSRLDALEENVNSLKDGMARILEALGEPKSQKKAS